MGFYSWDCEHCGESLKAPYDCEPPWQNKGVAICANGSIIIGGYDGYGKLDDFNITDAHATVYHHKCWVDADKPTDWKGESPGAADQGFFYG